MDEIGRWDLEPPQYHVAKVRVDGWKQGNYRLFSPEVKVITTIEEMYAYRPEGDYSDGSFDEFRELTKQYGPTAFNSGDVVLAIHIADSTGSASYALDSVDFGDEVIDISIRRTCPEAFTDDEAQWIVFIQLEEKGLYSGQSVHVNLTGI